MKVAFNRCAKRILRTLETGGRSTNVLRGLGQNQMEFEQAIGQLFIAGVVRWNGRKKARVLERKPQVAAT